MATHKTVLSGIQPSGTLHLGNYLGAIKQWVELQKDNTCYYCIVDLHAITVPYEAKDLAERVLDTAAMYIAAGVDPDKSIIFVQSHIPAHTELAWLLATQTPFGELNRMTQFKDKADKQAENTTLGLFAYPTLMAADILLYQADLVPVGDDQKQHLELTRDIAERFNNKFGETFTIPAPHIPQRAARIMSLADPAKKMSKSDSAKSYIALTDEPEIIRKKIMGAVTETEPDFSFEKSGPAIQNLLRIYQALSEEEPAAIEERFAGKGFKDFKEALAELVVTKLSPLQEKYRELRQNDDELRILLGRGKHHAEQVANSTLRAVKEKMGLL
jgi:tryptophanyl-tRNA synthetase